jgi:hypothetical protein
MIRQTRADASVDQQIDHSAEEAFNGTAAQ